MDEIKEKVGELHPKAGPGDILPDKVNDPEGKKAEAIDFVVTFKNINRNAVNGPSGWTNLAIYKIFYARLTDEERLVLGGLFADVGNAAACGTLHDNVGLYMTLTRLAMIPKYDEGFKVIGTRPVGIGEGMYRVMGKTFSMLHSVVGYDLAPKQLALGIKGGVEKAGRCIQAGYDMDPPDSIGIDDWGEVEEYPALLLKDICNAFNETRRGHIHKAACELAPGVVRLFRTFYGQSALLVDKQGRRIGMSETGTRQGCPLSQLFFCVGFQPTLTKLDRVAKEIAESSGSKYPVEVVAIADDVTILGGEKIMNELSVRCGEILEGTGNRINTGKSSILVRPGRREKVMNRESQSNGRPEEPAFKVIEEGVKVLGCPVGPPLYRQQQIVKFAKAAVSGLPALTRVNKQTQLALLKFCYNTKLDYLSRMSDPRDNQAGFELFDNAITAALGNMAGESNPHTIFGLLRDLKTSEGGLGIPRLNGGKSEKACIKSEKMARLHMEEFAPGLLSGAKKRQIPRVGHTDNQFYTQLLLASDAEEQDGDEQDGEEVNAHEFLSSLTDAHRAKWLVVWKWLCKRGKKGEAAWFLSQSQRSTGRFMNWCGGPDGRFRFTDDEFVAAFRIRALMDPYPDMGRWNCDACRKQSVTSHHPLSCEANSGSRTWRHEVIKDLTAKVFGDSLPGSVVRKEAPLGVVDNREQRGDIVLQYKGQTFIIDVCITDPTAAVYRDKGSYHTPDVAAMERELLKVKRFEYVYGDNGSALPNSTTTKFIPFVFEATGRMGPAAREFFHKTLDEKCWDNKEEFLQKVNSTLWRWNARMILAMRGRIPIVAERSDREGGLA